MHRAEMIIGNLVDMGYTLQRSTDLALIFARLNKKLRPLDGWEDVEKYISNSGDRSFCPDEFRKTNIVKKYSVRSRKNDITMIRHCVCWWLVTVKGLTQTLAGEIMGGRDHATARNSTKVIQGGLDVGDKCVQEYLNKTLEMLKTEGYE